MNQTKTDNILQPDPQDDGVWVTESLKSIDIYDDGPGDITVRPAPANIPQGWYPRVAPPHNSGPTP